MWPQEFGYPTGVFGSSRVNTRFFSIHHGIAPLNMFEVPKNANLVYIHILSAGGGGGGGHSAAAGNNRGGGGGGGEGAHASIIAAAALLPAVLWVYVGNCMGGTATNNGQGSAFEGDSGVYAVRNYQAGSSAIVYTRGGGGGAKGTGAGGGAGGAGSNGPTTFTDMTAGEQVIAKIVNHNNAGAAGGNAGGAGANAGMSTIHFGYAGAGGGSCSNTNVSGAGGDSIGFAGLPTRKGGAAGGTNGGAHGINGLFEHPIGGSTTANAQYNYHAPYMVHSGGAGGGGNNGTAGDGGNGGYGSGGGGGGGGVTGGKGGDSYGLIIIAWA